MAEAVLWYLALQLLALLSLVPALHLLGSLADRGYGLAKALGLLLPAYGLWILAWTGFLPNGRPTLGFVLLLIGTASGLAAWRRGDLTPWAPSRRAKARPSLTAFWRENWGLVLATEAVFAASFFAFALFRGFHPEIAGTEQPMDFAFLNATLRSAYFPPNDPWLSGYPISYYYFGYLIDTLPILITGIPSSIGYNLALASVFALTATGAFSLGYNLIAPGSRRAAIWVGALAALLLTVLGNLQGALEMVRARGLGSSSLWQWIGVNGALSPYVSSSWLPTEHFWWWHATRVINTLRITIDPAGSILAVDDRLDYTITEFPFFSFLLGDMHPHVTALPFVLLALGLALSFLRSGEAREPMPPQERLASDKEQVCSAMPSPSPATHEEQECSAGPCPSPATHEEQERSAGACPPPNSPAGDKPPHYRASYPQPWDLGWIRQDPLTFLGAALILGALGFINSWDLPTYMALALAALLVSAARHGRVGWPFLALAGSLAVASILLYLPFYVSPKPPAPGPGLVGEAGTRPMHFFIIWGTFLFALGGFLLSRLGIAVEGRLAGAQISRGTDATILVCLAAALALPALWAVGQATAPRILGQAALPGAVAFGKELSVVTLVLTVALVMYLLLHSHHFSDSFVLLLVLAGFLLTLGTELFFLRDAFGNRMNTMFKFYYQVWVLFAISSAYGIYWVAGKLRASRGRVWLKGLWGTGLAAFLVASLAYPVGASFSRMDMFRGRPGLDGLAFVKALDPAEYEAVRWLNDNIEGSPVIVEAAGGSYTEYGRISAWTGLPTIVQWPGHEMQWRGPIKEIGEREQDVHQIYSSADAAQVQRLLDRYGARYVYVGRLERARYGDGVLAKFSSNMETAFRNQGVTIYRVRSQAAP